MDIPKVSHDITYESASNCEYIFTVNFDKKSLNKAFNSCLRQLSMSQPIRGFRGGDHAMRFFKRTRGQSTLRYIIHSRLESDRVLHQFVESKKLPFTVYGYTYQSEEIKSSFLENPQLKVYVVAHADINFDVEVPKKYQIEITDDKVDKELDSLRVKHGKSLEVDVSFLPDKDEEAYPIFHLIKQEDHLDKNNQEASTNTNLEMLTYLDILPKHREGIFLGKKKGDTVKIKLSDLSQDDVSSTWTDRLKEAENGYTYEVKKVSRQELATLDEDLIQKLLPKEDGEHATYEVSRDGLRKYLEHGLKELYDQESDRFFSTQIFDLLREKNKNSLPEKYLEVSYSQYVSGFSDKKSEKRSPLERKDYDMEVNTDYGQESLFEALKVSVTDQEVRVEALEKMKSFIPDVETLPSDQLDQYAKMLRVRESLFQSRLQKALIDRYASDTSNFTLLSRDLFDQEVTNYNKK